MGATSLIRRTVLLLSLSILSAVTAGAQILVDGNSGPSAETVTLTSSVQFQNISVTAASSTSFTVAVSETDVPNIDWLKACVGTSCATGHSSPANGTTNTTLAVSIANDLGSSGAGPFHATVTLSPSGGGSATSIAVVFVPGQLVTGSTPVTPSSLTVSVASGGMATNMVTLQNNTGASFDITQINTTTTDGNPWLSASATPMTGITANSNSIITVSTDGSSLANGTYNGSVQLFLSNNPSVTIPVTFTVGASGLTVSTLNLGLSYNNGNSQSQSVTVAGATAYNAVATTSSGGNWMVLTAGSQSGAQVSNVPVATPLTVLVASSVAAGLSTGNYNGLITVTDTNNSTNTASISVTLSVNIGGATSITVTPSSLYFFAQTNGPVPPYQTLVLTAPTGSYSASNTQNWLFLGNSSGTIPGILQVSVANLSGLAAGTYSDQITLTAGGVSQTVPVNLIISAGPVANASFTTVVGQSSTAVFTSNGSAATPSSQVMTVLASDGSALTLSNLSTPSWLTVAQSGNQLTMAPNASGFGSAVLYGTVMVVVNNTAGTIANSPISIPVVLTTTGGTTGSLTFSPTSLSFQSTNGTVSPGTQSISVTAVAATPFTVSADSWINVSYSGNLVTPQTLTVTANPSGLQNGLNSGSINVTAGGVTQTIPVSLTVTGNPTSGGTISASPQTLNFTAVVGGAAQNQVVTVSSSGGSVSFTGAVSSSSPWLSVTPTSASTPTSVTVGVNPTGLAAGNYQGTVTFAAGNSIPITVNLTVQAPPLISGSASSLTFFYLPGGATPAPQTVTINGSTGGFTATATSDTGNWLSVSPASGNAGSTITVSVNPSGISTGQHTGTITVAGTSGLTGQIAISVTLTVNPPLPSVSSLVNGASFLSGPVSPGEVITLFGMNLGAAGQTFPAQIDSTGKLATQLGGVQVFVNNFLAPMIYVSATQVSAVVPYEIATNARANIWLSYQSQTSNVVTLPIAATAPGIFTQNSSGSGAAGYNANFSVNGPNSPAPKGSTVVLFLTGEGQTAPAGVTGTINSTPTQNPVPAASISVLIGGQPATYSYAGGIDGVVEGILQINAQVPANTPSGNVPVAVIIGGNSSQSGVTLAVQ